MTEESDQFFIEKKDRFSKISKSILDLEIGHRLFNFLLSFFTKPSLVLNQYSNALENDVFKKGLSSGPDRPNPSEQPYPRLCFFIIENISSSVYKGKRIIPMSRFFTLFDFMTSLCKQYIIGRFGLLEDVFFLFFLKFKT